MYQDFVRPTIIDRTSDTSSSSQPLLLQRTVSRQRVSQIRRSKRASLNITLTTYTTAHLNLYCPPGRRGTGLKARTQRSTQAVEQSEEKAW